MILGMIFIFFILCVIIMIPVAIVKTAKAKPIHCPQCEADFKLISSTGKCPNCKAKLFRHKSGEYQLRT